MAWCSRRTCLRHPTGAPVEVESATRLQGEKIKDAGRLVSQVLPSTAEEGRY